MGYKPFINDMFQMVYDAFHELYPDKTCEIAWDVSLEDNGERCYGLTNFCEDGSVQVLIDAGAPVAYAVETLAHELAHVAVGPDQDHGEEWEAAFDAIYAEYIRIGDEMFPDCPGKIAEIIPMDVREKGSGGDAE